MPYRIIRGRGTSYTIYTLNTLKRAIWRVYSLDIYDYIFSVLGISVLFCGYSCYFFVKFAEMLKRNRKWFSRFVFLMILVVLSASVALYLSWNSVWGD